MIVNFRARGIDRGASKLTQISTLIKKKTMAEHIKTLVTIN
jgi:hypothetical protein